MFCRIRYGQHFYRRYLAVTEIVDVESTFVDLCAGDHLLYDALKTKNIEYTAVEINPRLAERLRRRGINVILGDVFDVEIPTSDYVYMGGSLYHFFNYESFVIDKMQRAAKRKVIIIEPVSRFTPQKGRMMQWIIRSATKVNGKSFCYRYNYGSLRSKLASIKGFQAAYEIFEGNDCVLLFEPHNSGLLAC